MKNHLLLCSFALLALAGRPSRALAQGSAFMYQGRLNDSASPASGSYDLTFSLWNAPGGPAPVGGTITNSNTSISNGLFTVTLDFGNQFPGADRWLEIGVRTNGGGTFINLVPRQKITPTPYAIYAAGVNAAGLSGTIPAANLSGTYGNAVTFNNPANSFSGNGTGLTNVNAATLGGFGASSFWNLGGNAGTTPGAQFLGTADNLPLEFKVNGTRALRLEPNPNAPNVIGGSAANEVTNGLYGAVIAGGGSAAYPNRVGAIFGTVVGGNGNTASGNFATAMGQFNTASGYAGTAMGYSTVAGGFGSQAGGTSAKANHDGAFVWADNTFVDFTSTAANQFLIRAAGGVGINTNNPHGAALAVNGNVTVNGVITGNGTGLTNLAVALDSIRSFGALSWPGNFIPAAAPGVGETPFSITTADVNGDGKVDLISANYTANTLSVLLNVGNGNFILGSSPVVGSGPHSVTAADVNGDGKVDLISANSLANTLSVLTNNGNGNFTLASAPGVGDTPFSITSADVNGDGKVDLITANYNAHTLSVLTNNGNGYFTVASSPGVGTYPYSVTAADVNGDGKADLFAANYFVATLTVLTNHGNGSFTLAATLPVGGQTYSATAADVNGDGKVDLISANRNVSTLSVLTNNGTGNFTLASSPSVGTYPFAVTAADVNGDGKVDLISGNNSDATLSVLTNNGAGNFTLASTPGTGGFPVALAAADVNGDGRVDLISPNLSDSTISVLINAPAFNGTFSGNGAGLAGLNAANLTGTIPEARLPANVALRAGGNAFTGDQTVTGNLAVDGGLQLVANSSAHFGSQTRQMLNLWGTRYGIGVQSYTVYFRTDDAFPGGGFAWYQGGVHNDNQQNPGGGKALMLLDGSGKLYVTNDVYAKGVLLTSDRNAKENFKTVDPQSVLAKVSALPISEWSFKQDAGTRHVGPMAQDFRTAFGLGTDDKHIATVDADGVALAAIQGLNEKLEVRSQRSEVRSQQLETRSRKLEERLQQKETEITELKQTVNELKELVHTMNHKLNGGAQ